MKNLLFLLPLLYSCSTVANDGKPPTGEEMFDILLSIGSIKLSKEPLCHMKSVTRNAEEITLSHHLATVLSTSFNPDTVNTINSSCSKSKNDKANGKLIDIWDCQLEIKESTEKGEFISSSMIAFSVTLDKLNYLNGTLRCF